MIPRARRNDRSTRYKSSFRDRVANRSNRGTISRYSIADPTLDHLKSTDDGIQFAETQFAEIRMTAYQWAHQSMLKDGYFNHYTQRGGPASLRDMALRTTVRYRTFLEAESLEFLPWTPCGELLWTEINKKHGDNMAIWKVFVDAYGDQMDDGDESSHHYQNVIMLPQILLASAIPFITSSNSRFLSLLTVSVHTMDRSEWSTLCSLTNLRMLAIQVEDKEQGFNDRVARTWSNHALENGAFPRLRSILFNKYHDQNEAATLRYLSNLPALRFLYFVGARPLSLLYGADGIGGWRQDHEFDLQTARQTTQLYSMQEIMCDLNVLFESNWPDTKYTSLPRTLSVQVGPLLKATIFWALNHSRATLLLRDEPKPKTKRQVSTIGPLDSRSKPNKMRKSATRDMASMLGDFMG